MFDLVTEFTKKVEQNNTDWVAKGFAFRDKTLYPIGLDTKLLGRIFEILAEPILQEIADDNNYILETPDKQNYYPDFIMTPAGRSADRLAIDIKSTYRKHRKDGSVSPFKFTLGSYGSFLRNGTKNIQYSYDQYARHFVIGFVYDRNKDADSFHQVFPLDRIDDVPEPYSNVEYFIQEKYKIAGFGTGSGNTENIGTIPAPTIRPFVEGSGPFSTMGNDAFELYWKHYPKYTEHNKIYTDFDGFRQWLESSKTYLQIDSSVWERIKNYTPANDSSK